MSDELLYFNGVNASSGDYLLPPLTPAELTTLARGETLAPDQLAELKWRSSANQAHYGVKEGVDPNDLAQAGWGVIFASDADPAIEAALGELLEHRKAQANRIKERYRLYSGANGFRPNETKNQFLQRQGVGPGPVDPDRMPYYILIVGDPERIPYPFQYQLDVAYAVGRIHFDTPDDYAQYAQSVVQAETQNVILPRRAVFFGVENPGDGSTQASAQKLVQPLAETIRAGEPTWATETFLSDDATKPRLEGLLGGADTPALLFTASHGVAFDLGDPRQMKQQGALLTQEWAGPVERRPITQKMYFAADDVASDARVQGMIAFQFACYGAGTPRFDDFSHVRQGARNRVQIAPTSFLAKLPKRLLSHPKGGALAVIGHVDRAWGSSFVVNEAGGQVTVFESTLKRLMAGYPVGSATEFFNARYAELATVLNSELEEIKYGKLPDPVELASLWTAQNDARGYAVIGDPAVRLRVSDGASSPAQN